MAILGVGIDVVSVARLEQSLTRTPLLRARLFTPAESDGRAVESLAARFAAKEAVAKALGAPGGLRWVDAEVVTGERGRPMLAVHGEVAEWAASLGITSWQLSLSHDAGIATAIVIAQG